jgi:glycosyltransferase involved in cell wall biosynthesis
LTTYSVVICTRGTSAHLEALLAELDDRLPDTTELLVVHSGDAPLPQAIRARRGVVRIATPGIAMARQRGLETARGEVVVYLDDDVAPRSGWFSALIGPFEDHRVGVVAGAIEPVWPEGRAPRWLPASQQPSFGRRPAEPPGADPPFGANMAVRRSAALDVGGFALELGHTGTQLGLHEEADLAARLVDGGFACIDGPEAIVGHHIRPEQVRVRSVLMRAWAEGRSDRRLDRRRGRSQRARRAAKGAALLGFAPLAVLLWPVWPATAVHVLARLLVNVAYLVAR